MADAFDRFQGTDSAKGDAFDRFPVEEESFGKSAARYATQIPQGLAATTGPGLAASLFQALALGETDLPVEEWQRLRKLGEQSGKPFDEEAYENARQDVLGIIPTVSNIARKVEEKFPAIPLEPKTRGQKALRFGTEASRLIPGKSPEVPQGYAFRGTNTGLPRPVLGAGVAGAKEGLTELGVPEPISDIASFAVVKPTGAGASRLDIGKSKKESGLTNRRYENLENPKEISATALNRINDKTEKEFRDITNNIIEKSPIKETHEALANDVTFKKKAAESFKEVEDLAGTLPKTFKTEKIKTDLQKLVSQKKTQGLTPSEFDKSHNSFLKQFIKETPDKAFTAKELVSQYRKNNKQLSEAFEPGQSFAYNRAKREALLDYNKAIANIIENEFPKSEFSNLFKETNKRWADISNSESITKFLDELFTGKTNFKKARQLFDKEGMTIPFKKAMGEEGFAKFETLLNDLLSTEKGMKLLKTAEQKGFGDLVNNAGAYILHPNVAKAKIGYNTIKGAYNGIFNLLIDKPQLAVTWDRGINAMKRGDFKAAQKELGAVKAADEAFQASETKRVETLKKFNEKKKVKEAKPKSESVAPDEFRDNFMAQSSGQNIAEMNDPKIQVKKLKELRDAVKGNSQEAVKQRLPLTQKINEQELKLHNQKRNVRSPEISPLKLTEEEVERILDGGTEYNPKTGKQEYKIKPEEVISKRKEQKKNLKITTEKEKFRSRFSNIKSAHDENNNVIGSMMYDVEPSGEVYISGINTEQAFKKQGVGKKLFKNLLEEFPDKEIVISPLLPEGAEFFSKIIDRKLKPQLTENYEKIKNVSQNPIKLTKKDIKNAKSNLGITE